MRYFKVIVIISLLYSCKISANQTFDSEVKDLFFQADINAPYDSILKFYRALEFLKETEPEGFTLYPPLSALGTDGSEGSFHSFQFDEHPYSLTEIGRGRLNIDKQGYDKLDKSNFSIYYLFDSKQNAQNAYQTLVDKFSRLATNSETSHVQNEKHIEFFDSTSNIPGLQISLVNHNNITNGSMLTISVYR